MNVLLLRGLIRSQFHWGDFKQILERGHPNLRAFFLDFPGTGTEFARKSPTSIPQIRQDIRARFQQELSSGRFPSGRWALVSMSMGGMVGIDWVTNHPNDFEKFILVNSSARDIGGIHERFNLRALPQMLKNWVEFNAEPSEKLILDLTVNRPELRDLMLPRAVQLRRDYPITRHTFAAQIFAASRFRAPKTLPVSTTIIGCEKDRLVSVECSRRFAARYNAPLQIHPEAGHDISIDAPEWLADQIAQFLET